MLRITMLWKIQETEGLVTHVLNLKSPLQQAYPTQPMTQVVQLHVMASGCAVACDGYVEQQRLCQK